MDSYDKVFLTTVWQTLKDNDMPCFYYEEGKKSYYTHTTSVFVGRAQADKSEYMIEVLNLDTLLTLYDLTHVKNFHQLAFPVIQESFLNNLLLWSEKDIVSFVKSPDFEHKCYLYFLPEFLLKSQTRGLNQDIFLDLRFLKNIDYHEEFTCTQKTAKELVEIIAPEKFAQFLKKIKIKPSDEHNVYSEIIKHYDLEDLTCFKKFPVIKAYINDIKSEDLLKLVKSKNISFTIEEYRLINRMNHKNFDIQASNEFLKTCEKIMNTKGHVIGLDNILINQLYKSDNSYSKTRIYADIQHENTGKCLSLAINQMINSYKDYLVLHNHSSQNMVHFLEQSLPSYLNVLSFKENLDATLPHNSEKTKTSTFKL